MIPGRINTKQQSTSVTVPAPLGGLNGRDPLADMAPADAYVMDNIVPGTSRCYSRRGCQKHSSTALGAAIQDLHVYAGASDDVLLAFGGGKIWDVSLPAAVEKKTGLASNTAITCMFSNAADDAQHMIITTGTDTPMGFNGTTVSNLTMTGMSGSATTLNFCFAFKERLYFAQRDKLGFYYLPVGQIQGALSYFDLAQVSKLGGYLQAIGSFSAGDAGDTPQDYIVFVTSKGELIVYAGYDPSSAANWELVGRYFTAQPIGQRCIINYGTEMLVLTLDGALPFSEIRRSGDSAGSGGAGKGLYIALTAKLGNYLTNYNRNADTLGWMGLQYTSELDGWLILNVPATASVSGAYYHYVMNTRTNAWCRFTNWNGLCFAVFNRKLYFGRYDGYVMEGDVGRNDDEGNIQFDVKTAYNYFEDGSGLGQLQKHFQWAALLVSCDGEPPLSGRFNVDFVEDQPQYITDPVAPDGTYWDIGYWDTSEWGADERTRRFMLTLNKGGFAGGLWLRGTLDGLRFAWYATQYVMEKTRGLL